MSSKYERLRSANTREPAVVKLLKYGPERIGKIIVENEEKRQDAYRTKAYVNELNKRNPVGDSLNTKSGFVIPPLVYTGPGNALNRGPAYNLADEDAKEHDIAYHNAKTHSDIQNADRTYIQKAVDHVIEGISGSGSISDTIVGGAGALGIAVKSKAENVLGPIYPSSFTGNMPSIFNRDKFLRDNPGRYDYADDPKMQEGLRNTHPTYFTEGIGNPTSTTVAPTDNISSTQPSAGSMQIDSTAQKRGSSSLSDATPSKTIKAESSKADSSSMAAKSLPGTGKEQADIGGHADMSMVYHIEKPLSFFANRENVYRKSHKFMTFGLAPNIVTHTSGTPPEAYVNAWLTSYLAEVPWHIPAFYLNESEFNLLDAGVRCTAVEIEVYYRGTTLQFATASSATNLATLNQINDIAVAHALNKSGQGSNVSYTSFDSTQTMIPTGITRPKYAPVGTTYRGMVQDYYGTNNTNDNFVNYIPHHQVGRQTFLYNYWAQSSIHNIGSVATQHQFGGWPELADKIQQMDGKTCVNQCVLKSRYEPKQGALKQPLRLYAHGLPIVGASGNPIDINVGGNLPRNRRAGYTAATDASLGIESSIDETENDMTNTPVSTIFTIYSPIEKSQMLRSGVWGEQDPHIQPSIHIGVQPVPSLTTSATLTSSIEDGQWTDVRAYWEVVATMHTREYDPTEYPYATIPNVPYGDVIHITNNRPAVNNDPRADAATLGGLYTNSAITQRLGPDLVG